MARWTEADHTAVKAAYLQAMVDGIASATIAGQTIVGRTAAEWEKILDRIEGDLVEEAADEVGATGLRTYKIKPIYE